MITFVNAYNHVNATMLIEVRLILYGFFCVMIKRYLLHRSCFTAEHMLFMGSAEFPDENEVSLAIYFFVCTAFRKIPIHSKL